MSKNVHIVGTGTIGEPLIRLLVEMKDEFGLDRISFHKANATLRDRSKVFELTKSGAVLAAYQESGEKHHGIEEFRRLGMPAELSAQQALQEADVIIDCTPYGNEFKEKHYKNIFGNKLFLAQGSESGFGKPYARGINDEALVPGDDRFIQIVSCNTHGISSIIHTLAHKNGKLPNNLVEGDFVCIRRASDTSQSKFIPGVELGNHKEGEFGTHHALDAHRLFLTKNINLRNMFSSAIKIPTQYMHALRFSMTVQEPTDKEELLRLINENEYLALTYKKLSNEVFSFGRDHGFYGRIFNQAVVAPETLHVRKVDNGYKIVGQLLIPQDGNSLLSSAAATLWFFDPQGYQETLRHLKKYLRGEI